MAMKGVLGVRIVHSSAHVIVRSIDEELVSVAEGLVADVSVVLVMVSIIKYYQFLT